MCSAAEVRALTLGEVRALYAQRLTRDFPPDELKPLARIERALARGEYVCYGMADGQSILAYAFFVVKGSCALFDYLAVDSELRDRGVGGAFLRMLLEGPLSAMGCVLLEIDDPDCAKSTEEKVRRERRRAFYLRNGLYETGVRARVYGVTYRILALPVGERVSAEDARCVYAELYHVILPPKRYAEWVCLFPDDNGSS